MAPRSGASRTSYGFRLLEHLNKRADAEFFTRFLECANIQLPPVNPRTHTGCPRSGCKLLRFPSHSLGTDMCSYSTKSFWGNSCQAAESPHTKQIQASWPDVEGRVTTIIKISSTAETHPQPALYMIWQFGRYDGRGQRSSFTAPGQVPKCCPVVNSQMM